MVYSEADCVFVLEITIASKSLAAVPEALNNVYTEKEVLNKTAIH
jgi:hypothetical protein